MNLEQLSYPIGRFNSPESVSPQDISNWINEIENTPAQIATAVEGLTDEQLDTSYRPEGWTIRQVVHHLPDSHMNSYIRFKWTLTEDNPTIKAYHEDRWAELFDTKDQPIQVSLDFLKVVHAKLVNILQGLTDEQLKRTFVHPESGNQISLDWNIGMYAWHGEHHLAHIMSVMGNK